MDEQTFGNPNVSGVGGFCLWISMCVLLVVWCVNPDRIRVGPDRTRLPHHVLTL